MFKYCAGNLKIADFGLATLFLYKGQKRRLTTICGTKPYVAPEVAFGDYDGEMVDIWACGVILFVLLTGSMENNVYICSD